jgi:hypothetical protein
MRTRDPATIKTAANYSETQVWADYDFSKRRECSSRPICSIAPFMRAMNVNGAPSLWHDVLHQINDQITPHNSFSKRGV